MKAKYFNLIAVILMGILLYFVGVGSFTDNHFLPYSKPFIFNDAEYFLSSFKPIFSFLFYGLLSNGLVLAFMSIVARFIGIVTVSYSYGLAFTDNTTTEE